MAKKQEEVFFVNVNKPDELRRDLLGSSKTLMEISRDYERFSSANEQKLKEIERLKKKINAISRLISRLKSDLPTNKLKSVKKTGKTKTIKKEFKKPETELGELESDLDEIESKLNSLS